MQSSASIDHRRAVGHARRLLAAATCTLALCSPATAAPEAGATRADGGMLARLARSLESAPDTVRADFAAVALDEVLAAYEAELEQLREPAAVSLRERAKQARWGHALSDYLEGLYAARDAVDAGEPVEIRVAPPEPVHVLVGDALVPLTSPRIENPDVMDDAIVRRYCEVFLCDREVLEPEPPPAPATVVAGGWSLSDGRSSTYETDDGLGFMFRDIRGRAAKERVVAQVHEELKRLVAVAALAERNGRSVDWSALSVSAAGRGDDHRVVLTPGAPGVRVYLPMLAKAPAVVEVARPWIRAQARGLPYRQYFPHADLLLGLD